ncbi:MAG: hypothetical protein ACAH24_21005 [Hyphomicrobiaceae bacterium]|jgi:hypothetical protein
MASARILLVCSLVAALAACRTEAPRQSLKDHGAAAPAVRAPAAVAAPAPAPAAVTAPAPPPARTPAAAMAESDQTKDQLHAQCWDRYREYLVGDKPRSFEEKLSADSACRLIVCPTCPR